MKKKLLNKQLFFPDLNETGTVFKTDQFSVWIVFANGESECFPKQLILKEIAEKTIKLD